MKREMYNASVKLYKTETCRTHGLKVINQAPSIFQLLTTDYCTDKKNLLAQFTTTDKYYPKVVYAKSKYKLDEIVYLAEPMWMMPKEKLISPKTPLDIPHIYHYDLNETQLDACGKMVNSGLWKKVSPMFMQQVYGRHFIKITGIKLFRVHDITHESLINEGLDQNAAGIAYYILREKYALLFDKINGAGSWHNNPFVFSYQFEYLQNFKRSANA